MRQRIRPAEPPNRCRPACAQDNMLQYRMPILANDRERRRNFYQKYPWEAFPDILSALQFQRIGDHILKTYDPRAFGIL